MTSCDGLACKYLFAPTTGSKISRDMHLPILRIRHTQVIQFCQERDQVAATRRCKGFGNDLRTTD